MVYPPALNSTNACVDLVVHIFSYLNGAAGCSGVARMRSATLCLLTPACSSTAASEPRMEAGQPQDCHRFASLLAPCWRERRLEGAQGAAQKVLVAGGRRWTEPTVEESPPGGCAVGRCAPRCANRSEWSAIMCAVPRSRLALIQCLCCTDMRARSVFAGWCDRLCGS